LIVGACASGGHSDSYEINSAKVDSALERASRDASSRGKVAESLDIIERMYRRNSSDPDIALRYAKALRYADHHQKAALVLSPLVRAQEANIEALSEYASLQAAMGHYALSEDYARKAVLADPENGKNYHVLGIALDAQGFHKPAETAFKRALDNWNGDPTPVLNNLGLNLAAQGFLDEALEILRRAHQTAPERREIERNLRIVSALASRPYEGYIEERHVPLPPPKPSDKDKVAPMTDAKDTAQHKTETKEKQPVEEVKAETLDAPSVDAEAKPAPRKRSMSFNN